jgi:hypothetical protein
MQEQQENSHFSITIVFRGTEDDVIDELLSILKRDKWENLEMHYELGTLTAERTDLHVHDFDGEEEELPLTFALATSWFTSENEVEVMVEVNEAEQEWTYDACEKLCAGIITAMSSKFPAVRDNERTTGGDNGFAEDDGSAGDDAFTDDEVFTDDDVFTEDA